MRRAYAVCECGVRMCGMRYALERLRKMKERKKNNERVVINILIQVYNRIPMIPKQAQRSAWRRKRRERRERRRLEGKSKVEFAPRAIERVDVVRKIEERGVDAHAIQIHRIHRVHGIPRCTARTGTWRGRVRERVGG